MCVPPTTTLPRFSHLSICTRNFMFSLSLKKTHTAKIQTKKQDSKTKMLQQNKEYTHKTSYSYVAKLLLGMRPTLSVVNIPLTLHWEKTDFPFATRC